MVAAPAFDSTRGETGADFSRIALRGLASDGGLYVPRHWPQAPADLWRDPGLAYAQRAARLMALFTGAAVPDETLSAMAERAYGDFADPAIAPVTQLDGDLYLLELYHGPTLAFKDMALQLLGQIFDHLLAQSGEHRIILGATSGDTGAAAIEACRHCAHLSVVMLHPEGRISEVQRRLMTTVPESRIHNIAIDGSFDDCQKIVKALLRDGHASDGRAFAAINSINLIRVLAQSVYYFSTIAALGGRTTHFCVPTGNFGNAYAAYAAGQMGAPVGHVAVATNANDILARAIGEGGYTPRQAVETLSPAMDIQKASNFERLLYDLKDRQPNATAEAMGHVDGGEGVTLSVSEHARLQARFSARRVDDAATASTMAEIYRTTGRLIDPHTAVGVVTARAALAGRGGPRVVVSTAHPVKFPDTVHAAIGQRPALPERLADLMERPERMTRLPAQTEALTAYIRTHV